MDLNTISTMSLMFLRPAGADGARVIVGAGVADGARVIVGVGVADGAGLSVGAGVADGAGVIVAAGVGKAFWLIRSPLAGSAKIRIATKADMQIELRIV
jgi:hypothetical protein